MKAKRLVFPDQRKVEIEEFELADTPKADELLIENVCSVISPGTELAMYTKTHVGFANPANKYAKYPFRPGYCAAGKVIRAGADAKAAGFKEGELLMTRGHHASHLLANIKTDQWTMLERVPAGLDVRHAMMSVFGEISMTAVLVAHMQAGQTVAVFGQGLIGNFAAQLFRTCGAKRVIVLDPVKQRLETATKCGLKLQLNPTDPDWKKKLSDLAGPNGCQVVIEATGAPPVASQAIDAVAKYGKVVLLGSPRGSTTLDLYNQVHSPGIQIIGAHGNWYNSAKEYNSPTGFQIVVDFMADGRVNAEPLITHTLRPTEAASAYEGLLEKKNEYLGVVFDLKGWK